jgi:hypothetical protein
MFLGRSKKSKPMKIKSSVTPTPPTTRWSLLVKKIKKIKETVVETVVDAVNK